MKKGFGLDATINNANRIVLRNIAPHPEVPEEVVLAPPPALADIRCAADCLVQVRRKAKIHVFREAEGLFLLKIGGIRTGYGGRSGGGTSAGRLKKQKAIHRLATQRGLPVM